MNPEGRPVTRDPPSPRRPSWRLVLGDGGGLEPLTGAGNMAIDSALLDSVSLGAAPVLRFYRWDPACLSFGRNQPTRGRYDRGAARGQGIDMVRRPTGGQAVLHDDELTYAVIAPVALIGKPRAAYARVNEALMTGLRRLGVQAAVAEGASVVTEAHAAVGGGRGGPNWDAACFRRLERGEVVVGGAKLVGSAQRMESRTILQHGSVLVGGSQEPAETLLLEAVGMPAAGWTTLERELAERPTWTDLTAALLEGFRDVLGLEVEADGLTPAEARRAEELQTRYESEDWTWRR